MWVVFVLKSKASQRILKSNDLILKSILSRNPVTIRCAESNFITLYEKRVAAGDRGRLQNDHRITEGSDFSLSEEKGDVVFHATNV